MPSLQIISSVIPMADSALGFTAAVAGCLVFRYNHQAARANPGNNPGQ